MPPEAPSPPALALFEGLPDTTRAVLARCLVQQHFAPGQALVREGEAGDSLFFITQGRAEVRKRTEGVEGAQGAQGVPRSLVVNEMKAGEVLGDLSFLGGEPRSTTVVALEPTVTWCLARSTLLQQGEAGAAAAQALDARLAHVVAARLRRSTQGHADALAQRLAELQMRREFGRLFVATVAVVATAIVAALGVQALWPGLDPHSDLLNWGLLLAMALPMVVLVALSGRPLAEFGLTWAGGRRAALEGLAWGVAGVLAIAVVLHFRASAGGGWTWQASLWAYPLHVVLQEFVSRGVIQGSLQRFLDDRRGLVSVLLAALLFGLAHMVYGLAAVVVTFVSGIAFGAMYLRHGNLVGVCVLHAVLGLAAFSAGLI